MHVATAALLLLFITALCQPLSRAIRLPLPLLQIALGIAANLIGMQVHLEPDIFLLLFIPPLLFADAFFMPLREFRQLGGVILGLAVGLVLFTTLCGGLFVHWLIPPVPLAACFTLAAVLSPTDAVAVTGMLEGRNAPKRFLHVLAGEALLNDASGLVCFKFAAAAAMTGTFSIVGATGGFVLVAIGGLAVGAALAYGLGLVQRWLLSRHFDHAATFVTITALLPFAAYLAAERLDVSGILAAVAAGITIRQARIFGLVRNETRLGSGAVWEVLTFAFNGMVFVLLGLQLPGILDAGLRLGLRVGLPPWQLPLTVIIITGVMLLLRWIWMNATVLVRSVTTRKDARPTISWRIQSRLVLALSVAGVRGAITLAAVLSLTPTFPAHDLMITLATGVIVCSLLLAACTLPMLLRGIVIPETDAVAEADRARLTLARAAEAAVISEAERADPEHRDVLETLLAEKRDKTRRLGLIEDDEQDDDHEDRVSALRRQRLETAIRLRLLREERDVLLGLGRSRAINEETELELGRELDYQEQVLLTSARLLPRDIAPEPG